MTIFFVFNYYNERTNWLKKYPLFTQIIKLLLLRPFLFELISKNFNDKHVWATTKDVENFLLLLSFSVHRIRMSFSIIVKTRQMRWIILINYIVFIII